MPRLSLTLLVLAAADVSVRLPDVSFTEGTATRQLARGRLIAASASVHASREAGLVETALTLVWDSGEVRWKDGGHWRLEHGVELTLLPAG